MRIGMVSENASPLTTRAGAGAGGQHVHVAELAQALAERGHDVRVYARRDSASAPTEVTKAPGVTVVSVPVGPAKRLPDNELLPYTGDFGRWLASSWRGGSWQPDVVHAHFWVSGLAALAATAEVPAPVVQTFHALGADRRGAAARERDGHPGPTARVALERRLGRQVKRVIAQCRHETAELVAIGIPRATIRVAPSGVDTSLFHPHGPAASRPRTGDRILSVGRLVPHAGFDQVIRALPLVPSTELVIVGGPPLARIDDDPEARRLRDLAHAVGVGDRVRLIGSIPRADLPRWYRSATVVACTPWYGPFGLSSIEAMACGAPVVAYAAGGLTESVVDQVTGVLVAHGAIRALGGALRRLLSDEPRRISFASAGVDRARSRYAWERTAAEVERVYAEVIDQADGPAASGGHAAPEPALAKST
jgi:D-inositol-3-phosphate glycosyltransferase